MQSLAATVDSACYQPYCVIFHLMCRATLDNVTTLKEMVFLAVQGSSISDIVSPLVPWSQLTTTPLTEKIR